MAITYTMSSLFCFVIPYTAVTICRITKSSQTNRAGENLRANNNNNVIFESVVLILIWLSFFTTRLLWRLQKDTLEVLLRLLCFPIAMMACVWFKSTKPRKLVVEKKKRVTFADSVDMGKHPAVIKIPRKFQTKRKFKAILKQLKRVNEARLRVENLKETALQTAINVAKASPQLAEVYFMTVRNIEATQHVRIYCDVEHHKQLISAVNIELLMRAQQLLIRSAL